MMNRQLTGKMLASSNSLLSLNFAIATSGAKPAKVLHNGVEGCTSRHELMDHQNIHHSAWTSRTTHRVRSLSDVPTLVACRTMVLYLRSAAQPTAM